MDGTRVRACVGGDCRWGEGTQGGQSGGRGKIKMEYVERKLGVTAVFQLDYRMRLTHE